MEKVNLSQKFSKINEHWDPRIAGELNGLFLVVKGSFNMELRDKTITLNEGELLIVPRGVEHRPNAEQECEVMLFEPASTLNTGDKQNEFTKATLKSI
jgi:mannose-6-phosphate isomerase-like protein (cupin superfamily)